MPRNTITSNRQRAASISRTMKAKAAIRRDRIAELEGTVRHLHSVIDVVLDALDRNGIEDARAFLKNTKVCPNCNVKTA